MCEYFTENNQIDYLKVFESIDNDKLKGMIVSLLNKNLESIDDEIKTCLELFLNSLVIKILSLAKLIINGKT